MAAGGTDVQFRLARTSPLTGHEAACAVCGREREDVALVSLALPVSLAGSVATPPPSIFVCRECAEREKLEEGRSISDDELNELRARLGVPARDFSR